MDSVDIKTGTALVRMGGVLFGPQDAILDGIEAHVEKRPRVCAGAQIAADANAALRKQITAQSKVSRASQSQVVGLGNPKALLAGTAKGWSQETRLAIVMLKRQRRVRQVNDRQLLNAERRRGKLHPIAGYDPGALGVETPLRHFFIAGSDLAIDDYDCVQADLLDPISNEIHSGAVGRLIGIAGRVKKEAELGFVVPFRVAAGDALLVGLIKHDVAVGDD